MKNLKLNQKIEISFEKAKELIYGTLGEYDFDNLNESTITDSVKFEIVQNRKYYLTKTGRKGTLIYKGSEWERKVKKGIYQIEMTWDFRHPSNFALNQNNLSRKFIIEI